MISRPFPVVCSSIPRVQAGGVQVVLRLGRDVVIDRELVETLGRPFRDLATVGRWGGMAGLRNRPTESSMTLVADGVPAGSHDLVWSYDVTKVDAGLLLVLVNLVHGLHLRVSPVTALTLCGPLLRDGQAIGDELPVDFEPRPFPVIYEVETSQVVVDVELSGRHEPAALEPFREAWEAWMSIALHGAFADETYVPEKTEIFYEDELRVLSTGIGAVFDHVAIADAGFYVLLNMLQVLHATVAPIEEVTLE